MQQTDKKIKLLYIDDEEINRLLFRLNFQDIFEVYILEDAFQGIEFLEQQPETHLHVISDMKMPGMDGIEFIKIAKGKYPQNKYYIFTGYEINSEIKEALDTGLILKYFQKPMKTLEIKQAIDESADI